MTSGFSNTSVAISVLPAELLGEVFVECLPEHPQPSLYEAPLLLCKICSNWRSVALNTPRLWSSLFLARRKRRPSNAMLRAWLARSGILPLSIDVRFFRDTDIETMVALVRYAHRWRHVELATINLQPFVTAVQSLDALESIKLGPLGNINDVVRLSPILSMAPRLRSIEWRVTTDITSLQLPWTQLTHLRHHSRIATGNAIHLLASCPQLVEVYFHELMFSPERQNSPTVALYHLRTLEIAKPYSYAKSILHQVALPNLRKFRLGDSFSNFHAAFNASHLDSFFMHACGTLEDLAIVYHKEMNELSLIAILGMLSNLKKLDVRVNDWSDSGIGDTFVSALISHRSGIDGECFRLLPQLESIRLRGNLTFSEMAFLEMLKERCGIDAANYGAVLTTVDVEFEEAVSKGVAMRLTEYRDAGIHFPNWLDMVEGSVLPFPQWLGA